MENKIQEIIEKVEQFGWSVEVEDNTTISLSKESSQGQDFSISVDTENNIDIFIENLYECYNNFDVSYETYIWLDNEGHGTNGAPYDMRDLYDDMEECKESILTLYNNISK